MAINSEVIYLDSPVVDPGGQLDGCTSMERLWGYDEYSHHRIKQLMKEEYGIELMWMHPYKCGRYPGYKREYKLIDIATGEPISEEWFTNDDLRRFLAHQRHPVEAPKVKRHIGCVRFLEAVERLREGTNHE